MKTNLRSNGSFCTNLMLAAAGDERLGHRRRGLADGQRNGRLLGIEEVLPVERRNQLASSPEAVALKNSGDGRLQDVDGWGQLEHGGHEAEDGEGADGPEPLEGHHLKVRREIGAMQVLDTGPLQPDAERIDGDDGDVATHAALQVGGVLGGLKFNFCDLHWKQPCTSGIALSKQKTYRQVHRKATATI